MKNNSDNVKIFRENYDKNLTIEKNREILLSKGVKISRATYARWIDRYTNNIVLVEVPICFEKEVRDYLKKLKGE